MRESYTLDLRTSPSLALAFLVGVATISLPSSGGSQDVSQAPMIETLFVTRSLTHEQLMPYVREARPSVVQVGNYGAMFHGHASHPKATGWPMQLPVVGEMASLEFQQALNRRIQRLGSKVVGHFRLTKVMGHWKEQTGFVEYYNRDWPVDLLGEKPHANLIELLQRDAAGEPLQLGRYNQSQLAICLSSPPARAMLKQMLRVAIERGVDGVITTYNYNSGCLCPHCQRSFKTWLRKRWSDAAIEKRLDVEDLDAHQFSNLGTIPGYPDVESATELDWLAARWNAQHFKAMFDDIFLTYGRALKPGLIVAQWNHLGHVGEQEERVMLPLDDWARGEDYLWYSGGASFVGKNLSLSEGKAGDAWLSCLYVREMSGGKPFVMGKYDRVRLAASMAEGFATGGIGMGRYMRFEEPAGFETLTRYTKFKNLRRHLYRNKTPAGDVALILPRQSLVARRLHSLTQFRELGQAMLQLPMAVDVIADQRLSLERISPYRVVVLPGAAVLSREQLTVLRQYKARGGRLLSLGDFAVETPQHPPAPLPASLVDDIQPEKLSADNFERAAKVVRRAAVELGGIQTELPWTVRLAAYRDADRWLLHLVNYDRDEGDKKPAGPADERPQPIAPFKLKVSLPDPRRPKSVTLHDPDVGTPVEIPFDWERGEISIHGSAIRVYGVIEIRW